MARILLVEDDAVAADVLHMMLARMGHEVELAADGEEGVARFRERRHELVITDLWLPRKEGLAAILEMRSIEPAVKLIAISGGSPLRPTASSLDVARRMGAGATLSKPFTSAELAAAVDALLGREGAAAGGA